MRFHSDRLPLRCLLIVSGQNHRERPSFVSPMLLNKSVRGIYLQCEDMYTVSTTGLSHPSFWHLQVCLSQKLKKKGGRRWPTSRCMVRISSTCWEGSLTNLSFKRLKGYFEPGGNNGGGVSEPGVADDGLGTIPLDLEEFPAFPDLTIPFFVGIPWQGR